MSIKETLKAIGILQIADPAERQLLEQISRPFDLPVEIREARKLKGALIGAIRELVHENLYNPHKGPSLNASQLGHPRRIFVLLPAGQTKLRTFINPEILDSSESVDQRFEGCYSDLERRYLIERSLEIRLRFFDENGDQHKEAFRKADARLIQHEIDHLDGILVTRKAIRFLTLQEYEQLSAAEREWNY